MLSPLASIKPPTRPRPAFVALPFALLLATVAFAEPPVEPLPAPSFTTLGQESVDGIIQVSVNYPGIGGNVPGVLYLPSDDTAYPGILLNHDGEHGVDAALMRRARDLAGLGYVVMTPAYRADMGSLGKPHENGTEVGDVMAAAEALARHPRVSDEQIAILGTSHGAFVSMLAVMGNPKRFRCAAHASGATDVPRVASKVRIPVLLQHGWKDEVVDIGDAMYLSAELRRSGNASARLKEYSLLGHNLWFADDASAFSQDQVSQANWAWDDLAAFLDTYMKPGQAGARIQEARPPVTTGAGGRTSGH